MSLLPIREKQRKKPQGAQEGCNCGGRRVHQILQHDTPQGETGIHVTRRIPAQEPQRHIPCCYHLEGEAILIYKGAVFMHMKQHAARCMRNMEPHIDRKENEMDYKSGWSCKPKWLQSLKKCLQIELLSTRKCIL